jgi:hypothetical protein
MHAGADPGFVEQVDRDLLENAGADAAEDVVAGLGFEDYGIDAGAMQQLAEDEAGRSGTDDGDLCSHAM